MYITSISPSSYNTAEECEMKYFIGNVLRIREPAGIAAEKGTLVHGVLEYLALLKKMDQDSISEINHDSFGVIKAEKIDDINADEIFSKVTEIFLKTAANKFDDKDIAECKKGVYAVLNAHENPLKQKIISTEHKFSIEIDEPWADYVVNTEEGEKKGRYRINGIIDLIIEVDKDTIKFLDYKTGQRKDWITSERKDYDKLMKDIQLNIYHYCIRKLYPNYTNYILSIFYTKDGGAFDLVFSEKDLDTTLKKLKDQFYRIRDIWIPKQNKTWKCEKFCFYRKLKLEGAPAEFRKGEFDEINAPMCACSHINMLVKTHGIDKVTRDMKNVHRS